MLRKRLENRIQFYKRIIEHDNKFYDVWYKRKIDIKSLFVKNEKRPKVKELELVKS